MSSDKVDKILAQWLAVRPDLDCSAMGVVGGIAANQCCMEEEVGFGFSRARAEQH